MAIISPLGAYGYLKHKLRSRSTFVRNYLFLGSAWFRSYRPLHYTPFYNPTKGLNTYSVIKNFCDKEFLCVIMLSRILLLIGRAMFFFGLWKWYDVISWSQAMSVIGWRIFLSFRLSTSSSLSLYVCYTEAEASALEISALSHAPTFEPLILFLWSFLHMCRVCRFWRKLHQSGFEKSS